MRLRTTDVVAVASGTGDVESAYRLEFRLRWDNDAQPDRVEKHECVMLRVHADQSTRQTPNGSASRRSEPLNLDMLWDP